MLDHINDFIAEPLPRKILFFDDLLTPTLIRTLYWLGLLAVVYIGISNFFTNGFLGMFEAVVFVAAGVIGLRVMAELVMLLFKINENLEKVAAQAANASAQATKAKSTKKVSKKAAKKVSKKVSKKVTKKTPKD